jgi:hypothetical protein
VARDSAADLDLVDVAGVRRVARLLRRTADFENRDGAVVAGECPELLQAENVA